MNYPQVGWIDFRNKCAGEVDLGILLSDRLTVQRIPTLDTQKSRKKAAMNAAVFFDFDYPTNAQLSVLGEFVSQFPKCAVVMITQHHSAALAVWALHNKMWDYYVKPVTPEELLRPIHQLLKIRITGAIFSDGDDEYNTREVNIELPKEFQLGTSQNEKAISRARFYVESHYQDRVSAKYLANQLGMSPPYFSRIFRRICGENFSVYLLRTRLEHATKLLRQRDIPINILCDAVGISDPSYFSRRFRRYFGCTPTTYQQGDFAIPWDYQCRRLYPQRRRLPS